MQKESLGLKFLYGTSIGRVMLRPLVSKRLSVLVGKYMDSNKSTKMIPSFVKKNNINLDDYESKNYNSFNDFFTRKIKSELRPVEMDPKAFIAPCDGLLSAYHIEKGLVLPIKQSYYSINTLLRNNEIAKEYENGICLVFRLCVHHYHRYHYLDNVEKSENVHIDGIYHTVRPIALEKKAVFIENSREYTVMETENFGKVTQIEVGAMLVGKIDNYHGLGKHIRGEEKGKFLYGGSTIIVLVKEGAVDFPEELFKMTSNGIEKEVKFGEKLGASPNF